MGCGGGARGDVPWPPALPSLVHHLQSLHLLQAILQQEFSQSGIEGGYGWKGGGVGSGDGGGGGGW